MQMFKDEGSAATRILRAFAGGVILALALVHIIPDGLGDMDPLVDFPVGGATVLFGTIFMILIENGSQLFLSRSKNPALKHVHSHSHSHVSNTSPVKVVPPQSAREQPVGSEHGGHQEIPEPIKPAGNDHMALVVGDDHTHGCLRANNTANFLMAASPNASATVRQQVCLLTFFSCMTAGQLHPVLYKETNVSSCIPHTCFITACNKCFPFLSFSAAVGCCLCV